MKHKLAIGERFRALCEIEGCIDIKRIRENEDCIVFNNGIGITADEMRLLGNSQNVISVNPESGFVSSDYTLNGRHPTHKHKNENILVKSLSQRGETDFDVELGLDGNNEFLLDHVNGYHIPGLVFVEASRQVAMSIYHIYIQDCEEDVYFVLKDISSKYLGFAFPIDTYAQANLTLVCEKTNQYFITINFIQNGKKIVQSESTFTIHSKRRFTPFEKKSAEKAIKKQLASYQNQNQKRAIEHAEG